MKSSSTPPEKEALVQLLKKDDFLPDVSMQRQVETYVRELIVGGKLPISTKLPAISVLARMWRTSDYPVQSALRVLAQEGLLVQGTKRGTFVAPRERSLHRVCIYHNHYDQSNDFPSLLSTALYRLLSQRGIQTVPFFDRRPYEQLHLPPPEIRRMARHREVDAIIAPVIFPLHTRWLRTLGIPTSTIVGWKSEDIVEVDLDQFVGHVVDQARLLKRKRVGLIIPRTSQNETDLLVRLRLALEAAAARVGIHVIPAKWGGTVSFEHWEQEGESLCQSMLTSGPWPDMLVVFPDMILRGVCGALIREGASIPGDMVVFSHRNREMPIYTPFPVNFLEVKISDFAEALIYQLDQQVAGRVSDVQRIPVTLIAAKEEK